MSKKPVKQKKRIPLTAAQRQDAATKRQHIKFARDLFRHSGFTRISSASGKEFTYSNITSDFDDIFFLENVVIVAEYTTSSESNVSSHLKNKSFLYQAINDDHSAFIAFLKSIYPEIANLLPRHYLDHHFKVRIVYASRNSLRAETKTLINDVHYLDYSYLRYFANLTNSIRQSSRFELLDFLQVEHRDFGDAVLSASSRNAVAYAGSVLPEANSHFPQGFKVVSFYVDAEALLSRAYVLRRDGWRSGQSAYQRMISKSKIDGIRSYVLSKSGVFINNIIATLPPNTKLINEKDDTIDVGKIKSTTPGKVQLPLQFNSVGLIDGQHRVFSYHEGGIREAEIAVLRKQQNLLVTGIIFPDEMKAEEKLRFEAKLFLDINSNQTNAKSDLKQEIGLILKPYSIDSISKSVINNLNDKHGPLNNQFERHFFDKNLLKTTTVVSYGLRPLLRINVDDSLFSAWDEPKKDELRSENNDDLLLDYVEFCTRSLNHFLSAAKSNIANGRWTPDKRIENSILSTTFVNGLIACFRRVVRHIGVKDFDFYKSSFYELNDFDFKGYKSSQYDSLGNALYEKFFLPKI